MAQRILIVGKKSGNDYVGSRTQYLFNALTAAGFETIVYDIDGSEDIPPHVTTTIFLNWVQVFDKGWEQFLKPISGRKCLYTENWYWYDECRATMANEFGINLEDTFQTIAFSTNENHRWWPVAKCDFWGVCVDEDLVFPREKKDCIYIDQMWPEKWSEGIYNASKALDIAIPKIKNKHGVRVISQTTNKSADDLVFPHPEWVDEWIEPEQDMDVMTGTIASCRCYVTSHEESLGLMQFEAMMAGTPVVTSRTFSKNEVFEGSGVFEWSWPKIKEEDREEDQFDIEKASASIFDAIEKALAVEDYEGIRRKAIERFGKEAFVKRTKFAS